MVKLNCEPIGISSTFSPMPIISKLGIISDYPSGEFNLSSGRILACSPNLENELKNVLDKVYPFKKTLYT